MFSSSDEDNENKNDGDSDEDLVTVGMMELDDASSELCEDSSLFKFKEDADEDDNVNDAEIEIVVKLPRQITNDTVSYDNLMMTNDGYNDNEVDIHDDEFVIKSENECDEDDMKDTNVVDQPGMNPVMNQKQVQSEDDLMSMRSGGSGDSVSEIQREGVRSKKKYGKKENVGSMVSMDMETIHENILD